MRFFNGRWRTGSGPANVRVIADLGSEGRHVVVAAEHDGRNVFMVWEKATENTVEDSELFGTAEAAVGSWLRSHSPAPTRQPENCVVCDAETTYGVGFAGMSDLVAARLRELGASDETVRNIVEADARVKGRELPHEPRFHTVIGVPVCTDCADRAGLDVAMIGGKIPTYQVTQPAH